ncbi:MAG: hypothetical protein RL172_2517 [Bacteroidota bacterium]|jgi:hypothetical protein
MIIKQDSVKTAGFVKNVGFSLVNQVVPQKKDMALNTATECQNEF